MKRRIFLTLLCISFSFSILAWRLFWIQIVDSHAYSSHKVNLVSHSVHQRSKDIIVDDGRADFYDRHLSPLTGKAIHTLAVFPILNNTDQTDADRLEIKALVDELGISLYSWNQYITHLKEPGLWKGQQNSSDPISLTSSQVEVISALEIPNIRVVPYKIRYIEPFLASHLIGFVGQNPEKVHSNRIVGAGGLEHTLERLIQGTEQTTLSLFIDGKSRLLEGLNLRMNRSKHSLYPLQVVTTIDKTIQTKIEDTMDQMQIEHGAVVVLDAANAEIISMVSRPNYNPNDVHLEKLNWGNKALKATTPGSIFKIVVAASALEEGIVNQKELFQCNGSLGKYHLSCWKKSGHGSITFEQAFAQSCNVTFAKVMERIPSSMIMQTSEKMGLLRQIGWSTTSHYGKEVQLDAEEIGKIFAPATPRNDGGVRAQTSIGQRDVMITPLQAANMIVTLLHDGEVQSPKAIKEVRYRNGGLHTAYSDQVLISRRKGISTDTARTLLHWMRGVVTEGTGQSLKYEDWILAGKSGTAQIQLAGKNAVNQWFIGYGPTNHPKYAAAVLVQTKTKGNRHEATQIFGEVMKLLAEE